MSKNNILKRLSPIHIVALICAAVIFVTVVVSSIFYIRNAVQGTKREFDYTKETLTDYITLGDYENLTVAPEYNKLRAVDVKSSILTLVAGEKNYSSDEITSYNTATKITTGDVVNIYYRGYVLEDGSRDYMNGMTNLAGSTYATMKSYALSIGADTFIAGFSLALDGKTVGDFPKMEVTRNDEAVTGDVIAFVTYTRYPMTTNQYSGVETQGTVESATSTIVDLTDKEAVIAAYGEEFYNAIVGVANDPETEADETIAAAKANGENVVTNTTKGIRTTTEDGTNYKYTKIAVEYTMAADYYENYQPIEVQFPADYSTTSLAGKTAYFQILIESVKEYSYTIDGADVKDVVTLENVDSEDEAVKAAARAVINPILKEALKDNDDFMATVTLPEEGAEDTNDYYQLYTDYLFAKDEEDNAVKYKNALYQAIIDALVDSTEVKAEHPDVQAKYEASLITFRTSYNENGSGYTIEEYAEIVIGGDHYVYVYEDENGEWKVLEGTPAEDDTTEYKKVFDWKAAVMQLSVDYYTEKMAVHQIIKDKNLNVDGAYDAAYAAICDEYSAEYKKSYCTSNGIDIDNMTAQEKQAVDAAAKSYLQSSLGFEYLKDRAYYQLVLDYIIDNTNLIVE